MDNPRIIVVGGGIAGMVSALFAAQYHPAHQVILLERTQELGGLLRSFQYEGQGCFDYGAHIWHQTGIAELDDVLLNVLPTGAWSDPEGFPRELPGLYYNGHLQTNGSFVDLRHVPQPLRDTCVEDMMVHIAQHPTLQTIPSENAYEYALERFGPCVTENVIAPAIEKLFQRPLNKMHRLALLLMPLAKVLLFDENEVHDKLQDPALFARIGYTNQRELPSKLTSGHRLFYPKTVGMQAIVDALEERLVTAGVRIERQTALKTMEITDSEVTKVHCQVGGDAHVWEVDHVIWSVGVHPLAGMLGLFEKTDTFDVPQKTVLVNLTVSQPVDMDDLFYFYCFEPGFHTYRVVNYANYCSDAIQQNGVPLTMELFFDPQDCQDIEHIGSLALEELQRFGIMQPDASVLFSQVEVLQAGFPLPSSKNMALTHQRREKIKALGLENLTMVGILSEEDLFFQTPTIMDAYHKMKTLKGTS